MNEFWFNLLIKLEPMWRYGIEIVKELLSKLKIILVYLVFPIFIVICVLLGILFVVGAWMIEITNPIFHKIKKK